MKKQIQKSLGICIGASTVKVVELVREFNNVNIASTSITEHGGNPREELNRLNDELDLSSFRYGAVTGRKFREFGSARSITEPEAVEYALAFDGFASEGRPQPLDAVLSLGAESFIAYFLNRDGSVSAIETGNKCASGTGEFFVQQLGRMGISVEEAVELALASEPHRVSGRCSVFCKSDCTHALNKGVPIGKVASGLCGMMAERAAELVERADKKHIAALGGVTKNRVVMDLLRERVDQLYIPKGASYFEALGAAYFALVEKVPLEMTRAAGHSGASSFAVLTPIENAGSMVEFAHMGREEAQKGDECVLGLDVGSTTTKAVLLRTSDNAVLASEYLRTSGDPVKAARQCYGAIDSSKRADVEVVGIGVTGSGRHIAGLHASTTAVINEIIAHATGAAFFNPGVDTIFEIGGQDAKYTHLTNGVPSDYAMNEACSAGTGSFLEESALESLGVKLDEIEKMALPARRPPNFSDQCAAFISSDIKTAAHEGQEKEDIVAGLVYSVCMNYLNRVKGQRPVGKKIFMQGGVCYNKAVPLAMASLLQKHIVVPPDPGLVGALGVALEVKKRIEQGLVERSSYSLKELSQREVTYAKPFICKGSKGRCDRKCEISMPVVNGKKYPFGGACDRFYNRRQNKKRDFEKLDLVARRQERLFESVAKRSVVEGRQSVGISRSYFANSLFPMFNKFFKELGFEVVLSERSHPDGCKKRRSSFCYPGELAHGFFYDLLTRDLDYIFLPKIMGLAVDKSVNSQKEHQSTCVLLQSEAYYLRSAFKNVDSSAEILAPVLDFCAGLDSCGGAFEEVAKRLGVGPGEARRAYELAVAEQERFTSDIKTMGREFLSELERDPNKKAVVLFGRPYNAFAKEANMGVPAKFASRGAAVIPWECLPFEDEPCDSDMCWAVGQNLLKAASFAKKHPQLFSAFVTNFSCGPDSFLVGYFRDIMKSKPSLTLELDSHTADAGVNTRIDAFLDIVDRYRGLRAKSEVEDEFVPADVVFDKKAPHFISSEGERVSFFDKRVRLLVPSMGRLSTEVLTAAFQGFGIRAVAIPVYDNEDLKLGRANASCKECLPLLLTTGGLLKYLETRDPSELIAYFMPFTPGNCRFSQYRVFLKNLIKKRKLKNVALFSLTAENGYVYKAFSGKDRLNVLKAFIAADVMEDVRNALFVLAKNRQEALEAFEREWEKIIEIFRERRVDRLYNALEKVACGLAAIPLRRPLDQAPKVGLMGEVFVRRDYFSSRDVVERLAKRGIVVKKAHFFEWLKYVDTIIKRGVLEPDFDLKGKLQFFIKQKLQSRYERKIKTILSKSGLYEYELADIDEILKWGESFFDLKFRGESILVVGGFFKDISRRYQGVVSIGPFACMPTRVIEAVLSAEATSETKSALDEKILGRSGSFSNGIKDLPFLSIECDGNPLPQILEARIDAFCLQVERLGRGSSMDFLNPVISRPEPRSLRDSGRAPRDKEGASVPVSSPLSRPSGKFWSHRYPASPLSR